MAAQFIPIGEPAHDAERQALRFLVEGLPADYTVYGNPWLVERSGVVFELDAVVVAPHALFVVEIKSYRGRIEGTDNDWWLPEKIRSPLKLNRVTAQVLKTHLKNASYQAGQVWTEGLVFLSATTDVGVRGPASNDRVHTQEDHPRGPPGSCARRTSEPGPLENAVFARPARAARALHRRAARTQAGPPRARVRGRRDARPPRHVHRAARARTALGRRARPAHLQHSAARHGRPTRSRDGARALGGAGARSPRPERGRPQRRSSVLRRGRHRAAARVLQGHHAHHLGRALRSRRSRQGEGRPSRSHRPLDAHRADARRNAPAGRRASPSPARGRSGRGQAGADADSRDGLRPREAAHGRRHHLAHDRRRRSTGLRCARGRHGLQQCGARVRSVQPRRDARADAHRQAAVREHAPADGCAPADAPRARHRAADPARASTRRSLGWSSCAPPIASRPLAEAIDAVRVGQRSDASHAGARSRTSVACLSTPTISRRARASAPTTRWCRASVRAAWPSSTPRATSSAAARARSRSRAPRTAAEEALRGEYQVLSGARPSERRPRHRSDQDGRGAPHARDGARRRRDAAPVDGACIPTPEPTAQRRLAEDLLAGLDYLEQKSVTHKDLKPDNLLVSDGRLTIIDFSLAAMPEDAPYGGTALYRDPASARWTHATDRFAAALCLFELYAGRHAFEGRVPEPGQAPCRPRRRHPAVGPLRVLQEGARPDAGEALSLCARDARRVARRAR